MSDKSRLDKQRAWCRDHGYDERAAEAMLQAQDQTDSEILDHLEQTTAPVPDDYQFFYFTTEKKQH